MPEQEYSPLQLREMSDEEARETLTVDQYERREKLIELHEQADETKEQWEQQAEQVTDLTVHADPEQLGVEVDLFGNDVLVHIDSDDRHFRQAAQSLEDAFDEDDPEDIEQIDGDRREDIADHLQTMLGRVLVRWNGHVWGELPADDQAAVLAECREQWGVDGLMLAWLDIAEAVHKQRQKRVDVIESFRGA